MVRLRRVVPLLITLACFQFVPVTLLAMGLYSGSTITNLTTPRYLFFQNFFSDLGRTVTYSGVPNTAPMVLFIYALVTAGLALVAFFIITPAFIPAGWSRRTAWVGSIFGVLSGIFFLGIAVSPADVTLDRHIDLVYWAFESFLAASVGYAAAIFMSRTYPKKYAVVFLMFAVCLAGYLWLLFEGPQASTPAGNVIQATGQKLIVYIAIVSMGIQGMGLSRIVKERSA